MRMSFLDLVPFFRFLDFPMVLEDEFGGFFEQCVIVDEVGKKSNFHHIVSVKDALKILDTNVH